RHDLAATQPHSLSLHDALPISNSRVIRGATLTVMQSQFVEAARAMGCGHMRIIVRHLLPNVVATIIILATIGLGAVILAESALSDRKSTRLNSSHRTISYAVFC